MSSLPRYWHTVRHLKPVQLYGRLWFRLGRPRADARPAPARRPVRAPWARPAERGPSLTSATRLTLLGHDVDIDRHGWDDPSLDHLLRYHLHYFDDLAAAGAAARSDWQRALLARWMRENPPGRGTGWEPYPTSLRIVNWIKWVLAGNEPEPALLDSLASQARWLAGRLERHLLGNHLFANAKALVMAGRFFEGDEAAQWLAEGLRVLAEQLPEQVLPDGGQFELSPMYHALAFEDVLDLCNTAAAFGTDHEAALQRAADSWNAVAPAMARWLAAMCHPDGGIGFFNDAALDVAPEPAALRDYAARVGCSLAADEGLALTHLAASGYVRLAQGPAVALLDVARVGPDYLPAHAHADTLSFELSLFGGRVLVNSGTSVYGRGAERLRQRGTAAHNTVIIDGQDSSEVWSGFRVARRARPRDLEIGASVPAVVRCAHDGYQRLAGRPVHTRAWALSPGALVVTDSLTGTWRHAQARWHLHPSVRAGLEGDVARLALPGGGAATLAVSGGRLRAEPSSWHPRFGASEPAVCLAVDLTAPELRTELRWNSPPSAS